MINWGHNFALVTTAELSRNLQNHDLIWCLQDLDYGLMNSLCMMTSSNGNIFHVTGPLCGEFTGHRWIPLPKASARSFEVFFDLHLNKLLRKQSWGWWFEIPSCSLWRHCNGNGFQAQYVQCLMCGRVIQWAFQAYFACVGKLCSHVATQPITFPKFWMMLTKLKEWVLHSFISLCINFVMNGNTNGLGCPNTKWTIVLRCWFHLVKKRKWIALNLEKSYFPTVTSSIPYLRAWIWPKEKSPG